MTGLEVHQVPIAGRSPQRAWFDGIPAQVYEGDPQWSPASGTVATQCFDDAAAGIVEMHPVVVRRSGRAVARAAGIINPKAPGTQPGAAQGWLGLVECLPEDHDAGQLAIEHCQGWLQAQGCSEVVAPSMSALMSGLLVAGFDRPQVILTPHNPPWYADLFLSCGFRETSAMVALEFSRKRVPRFLRAPGPPGAHPSSRHRPASSGARDDPTIPGGDLRRQPGSPRPNAPADAAARFPARSGPGP